METIFKTWTTSRKLYNELIGKYSLDQLNHKPEGFSNNLAWNLGHIIVAQQALIYKGSGQPMHITDELLKTYMPGTFPTLQTTAEEIEELTELLLSPLDQTRKDFHAGLFGDNYQERTTGTGLPLVPMQDAINFTNYHQAPQQGVMMNTSQFY